MCDVNIISGEVYHFSRDVYLPGPIPFVVERSYCSGALSDGPLGWGWQLSLDVRVTCTFEATLVRWDDGTQINLPPLQSGEQIDDTPTGLKARREFGTVVLVTADGTELHL